MDNSQVSFKQERFAKYGEVYEFLDDVWGGLSSPDELRQYLPKRGAGPTLESPESYALRLRTTKLPRSFRDGIEKGVGKFGLANLSEDTPQQIQDIEENIDGLGTSLDLFVATTASTLLRYGSCVLLPDIDDEQNLTISLIPVSAIQNAAVIMGRLQRLVICSEVEDIDG